MQPAPGRLLAFPHSFGIYTCDGHCVRYFHVLAPGTCIPSGPNFLFPPHVTNGPSTSVHVCTYINMMGLAYAACPKPAACCPAFLCIYVAGILCASGAQNVHPAPPPIDPRAFIFYACMHVCRDFHFLCMYAYIYIYIYIER